MRPILLLSVLACACAVDEEIEPDDEGDAEPEDYARAADPDEATVAQVNPYYGGRFSTLDTTASETYRTARRFAAFARDKWPRLSVIGMEEIDNVANAERFAEILTRFTGHPWSVQHFGRGADDMPSTQEAIFWRSDVWTPIEVLGTREIASHDTARGPATLSVRFGGILLRRNGTNHELAMFAGKLSWLGRTHHGDPIDNNDRARQVDRLRTWIDNKLLAYPNATRVVAMDVNADYESAPWRHMRRQYGDGGDDRATHWTFGAKRLDGLFWDHDAGAKRSDDFGFVGGPYRSARFGSDHRAVAARIKLR